MHESRNAAFALAIGFTLSAAWVVTADVVYHNDVPLDAIAWPVANNVSTAATSRTVFIFMARSPSMSSAYHRLGLTSKLWPDERSSITDQKTSRPRDRDVSVALEALMPRATEDKATRE